MAGLSREDFDAVAREIQTAWGAAQTRDAAFNVIVDYGRKYGYKNVIAAIQQRTPKRFESGQSVDSWLDDRRREEASE
jgi:hypothetical protein